jgi:hypothetical protein
MHFMGMVLDTKQPEQLVRRPSCWLTGSAVRGGPARFAREWGEIQEYIEAEIKRREA